MMTERKRRADMNNEMQRHWREVMPEETTEISKRLRLKLSCQDRYSATNPYEFPADEEAAHRIIAAHWARKEVAAAHATTTNATENSRRESRLPRTEPDMHSHTESWKRAVPADDALPQLPRNDPLFGGKACTEPLRSPRVPVLLGLERQYCHPQPHPNSEFF
ncbi:hypothetical protein Esti_002255 [Eimeria stiedai]